MKTERKIVKTRDVDGAAENSDKIKTELDTAIVEYEKVKKLIDYFVLGLMLVVVLYTIY